MPQAHKAKQHESVLVVHCDSVEKVNAALQAGAERILFGGDCFNHQLPSGGGLCQGCQAGAQGRPSAGLCYTAYRQGSVTGIFHKLFTLWEEMQPDFVYINNNGLWPLAKKHAALNLVADMSLNIFNSQTLQFWQEQGVLQVQCSAPS